MAATCASIAWPCFPGTGASRTRAGALARLKKLGARIRPMEWNRGEHVVLMGVVAPFGGAEQVVEEVKVKLFAGKEVHMLRDVAGGRVGN